MLLSLFATHLPTASAYTVYKTGSGNPMYWWENHTPEGVETPCGHKSTGGYTTCIPDIVTFPGYGWNQAWDANLNQAVAAFKVNGPAPTGNLFGPYFSVQPIMAFRYTGDCIACVTDFGAIGLQGHSYPYCGTCTSTLGITQPGIYSCPSVCSQDGDIITATTWINTNSAVPWSVGSPAATATQINLTQTIMHELGHTIGLRHPVSGPKSGVLMECYQALGENQVTLSNDDTAGVTYLYGINLGGGPGGSPC